MARDAQTATAGITDFTRSDYIQLVGGGVGIVPYARQVHRGVIDLNGSGVGDTADCRLTLPLPSNAVWQLDQWHFQIEGTAAYDNGLFEIYYAPSTTNFGDSTLLQFPVSSLVGITPAAVGDTVLPLVLGGQPKDPSNAAIDGFVSARGPFDVITYNDVSGGADPVLWIGGGGTTNVASGTLRFACSWLGFTFEQMNKGLLHAGLASRS